MVLYELETSTILLRTYNLRLQVINETHLSQHHYLTNDDQCYFLGEFSPGLDNWTNIKRLIHNLKKNPTDIGFYPYKEQSILQTISLFENLIFLFLNRKN